MARTSPGLRLSPGPRPDSGRGQALARDLKAGLAASDALSLVYQPRIELASGDCASVEALLRWRHPIEGDISPAEFIPLAEAEGLLRELTDWVTENALIGLGSLSQAGFSLDISINVSSSNLDEFDFADRIRAALTRHCVDPERLELEITEDVLIKDSPEVRARLAELAEIGVGLCLDDFGAGNSNLNYLRDLPMTTLKIDRAFVRELAATPRDQIIVRSILSLAHALDYRVVAEGIEDAEALALLAAWGCDEGQGFHLSPPLPLAELQPWLSGRQRHA